MKVTIEYWDAGTTAKLFIKGEPTDVIEFYNGIFNWGGTSTPAFDDWDNSPTDAWISDRCLAVIVVKEKLAQAYRWMALAAMVNWYGVLEVRNYKRGRKRKAGKRAQDRQAALAEQYTQTKMAQLVRVGYLRDENKATEEKVERAQSFELESEDEAGNISRIHSRKIMEAYSKIGIELQSHVDKWAQASIMLPDLGFSRDDFESFVESVGSKD